MTPMTISQPVTRATNGSSLASTAQDFNEFYAYQTHSIHGNGHTPDSE
jgi:hypothetical protein